MQILISLKIISLYYIMPNAWVEHVRKFAAKRGMSYGCAVSDPECKAQYHRQKERNAKKTRTPAQETEGMGAEDVNVAEKPKKKKSMPDDVGKLIQDFARPAKRTFEENAKRAKIKMGFDYMENWNKFHTITHFKTGKRKGQFKAVTITQENMATEKAWKNEQRAKYAKKYDMPEDWEEKIRDQLGNKVVNDWHYIGEAKWQKIDGNPERLRKWQL